MGKFFLYTAAALLILPVLAGPWRALGMTDEEIKRAFLQSRGAAAPAPVREARETPEPKSETKTQPRKKPKPRPARKRTAEKAAEPEETPRPTPTPKPPPEKPRATPAPPEPSPTPAPRLKGEKQRDAGSILVEKSGGPEDAELLPPPPPERHGWWIFGRKAKYKYLTPAIRRAIDKAPVKGGRWRYIVVHNSGTRQGNAKAFDYYHTHVRKMPNGLAYHFVIGNGTSSGNGAIEIGNRWVRQINGGHVHSDFLNNIALGICLVGDYNRDRPTKQQLEALDELIRYLRRRVGKTNRKLATIKAHKDINPVPTDCPGKKFPYRWLYSQFD